MQRIVMFLLLLPLLPLLCQLILLFLVGVAKLIELLISPVLTALVLLGFAAIPVLIVGTAYREFGGTGLAALLAVCLGAVIGRGLFCAARRALRRSRKNAARASR